MGKKFNAFFIFLISFGRVKVTILIHQPSWRVTIDVDKFQFRMILSSLHE